MSEGVETEGADAMRRALDAGKGWWTSSPPASIATTLSAPRVAESTLAVATEHLEDVVVVPDAEAVASLEVLLERVKVLAEPAASCTLAAAGARPGAAGRPRRAGALRRERLNRRPHPMARQLRGVNTRLDQRSVMQSGAGRCRS